jgi:hypothetical protein
MLPGKFESDWDADEIELWLRSAPDSQAED